MLGWGSRGGLARCSLCLWGVVTTDRDFLETIARSSIGAYAWCGECKHPDLNHSGRLRTEQGSCFADGCSCQKLRRMTVDEFLEWKRPLLTGVYQTKPCVFGVRCHCRPDLPTYHDTAAADD